MGPMSEFEYLKYSALNEADVSGEINLEGIKFPQEIHSCLISRLARKAGSLIVAFFRTFANSIKETPAEYNAKVARWREERPHVRGLR